MTFYVDNSSLKACLHGYETLPISEVPLAWRRLLIFDDTMPDVLAEFEFPTVETLIERLPSWKSLIHFIADVADDMNKVIYVFSSCMWFQLEVCHRENDFQKTRCLIHMMRFDFERLKVQDILVCPCQRSLYAEADLEGWLVVRDKALEIESEIDGLSLRPLPLTQEDLIRQLVDKLRLLSNQNSI